MYFFILKKAITVAIASRDPSAYKSAETHITKHTPYKYALVRYGESEAGSDGQAADDHCQLLAK